MERKTKIYLIYGGLFVLTIIFGISNYLIKIAELKRSNVPIYQFTMISPQELKELMDKNKELIIIDTRVKEHYDEGHINGATNFSYMSLKAMNKALAKEKTKDIVIYSEDGEKAKLICEILVTLGYSKLRNLKGGIKAWKEAGMELAKPAKNP